jgi:hypothetical protein
MLTDAEYELITAAVDGELPPDREAAFHALLARNQTAATLFAHLKGDSRRLRGLPRRPAPPELASAVAARVVALPRATPHTIRPRATRRAGWAPYVVAASLLLAVTAASFWVSLTENADDAGRFAQQQRLPRPHDPTDRHASTSPAVPAEPVPELGPSPRRVLPEGGHDASRLATLPRSVEVGPESAPIPRVAGVGNLSGSPLLDTVAPFDSIETRLPVLASVSDLDRNEVRDRLVAVLGRDPAFRLDLFVKDVPRAAEAIQSAARAVGVDVTIEPTARDRLRKKLPTALAIYTDALTSDEVARFLAVLAKRDRSKASDPVFTMAHLVPVQASEQRDFRDLLGVDLVPGKRKAIGSTPLSSPAVGEKDRAAKPAIMLTYLPAALRVSPTASKEVKAFLDRRAERKPSGVPLLVVIRPAH